MVVVIISFFIFCLRNYAIAQQWIVHTIPKLSGEDVRDILVARADSSIWVATEMGVNRFDGEWKLYNTSYGLVYNNVRTIVQDNDDFIWLGTSNGISKINPLSELENSDNWWNYPGVPTDSGLIKIDITSIVFDGKGQIWFGTRNQGIFIVKNFPKLSENDPDPLSNPNNWWSLTFQKDTLRGDEIRDLLVDDDGNVWIATAYGINIYRISDHKLIPFHLEPEHADRNPKTFHKDRQGNIWIGTNGDGLFKVLPNELYQFDQQFTKRNGIASNSIISITQDLQGLFWIVHSAGGLSVGYPKDNLSDSMNWKIFTSVDGLADNSSSTIAVDFDDNIWIGHREKRGVTQLNQSWVAFVCKKYLNTNRINGLFPGKDQDLWIASDYGAIRLNPKDNLLLDKYMEKVITMEDGLADSIVNYIFMDSLERLWFGTNSGLNYVYADAFESSDAWHEIKSRQGLIHNKVNCIGQDSENYLWFGTDYGLSRVMIDSVDYSESWLNINAQNDSLISDRIYAFLLDSKGRVWIGTYGGIGIIQSGLNPKQKQNWVTYNSDDGLIYNQIESIFEDMEGRYWITTKSGVTMLPQVQDIRNITNWIDYTQQTGLAHDHVEAVAQIEKDVLWFGTAVGVSKFDQYKDLNPWTTYANYNVPAGLISNWIRALYVDRKNGDLWIGTSGGGLTRYRAQSKYPDTILEIEYDVIQGNRVEYQFHGTDLSTLETGMRYYYKIDGKKWNETENTNVTLFFEKSDKTEYHIFSVKAIDSDGNIDPTPATDGFWIIQPELGGWIETTLGAFKIEIHIPPNTIDTRDIEITNIKLYELQDSLAVAAFELLYRPPDSSFQFEKPATIRIFLRDSLLSKEDNKFSFHYQISDSVWQGVGGRTEKRDNSIEVSTTITEFGKYVLRKGKIEKSAPYNSTTDEIEIQPRVFSPANSGRGFGDRTNISFTLKEPSDVSVKVYNLAGRLIKNIEQKLPLLTGRNVVVWDGRDYSGNICPTGLYIVTVQTSSNISRKTVMISNKY